MPNAVNLDELEEESINSSIQSVVENIEHINGDTMSNVDEKYQPFFKAFKKHIGNMVKKGHTHESDTRRTVDDMYTRMD